MIRSQARHCLAACGAAAMLLATPSRSEALFHWFGRGGGLFHHRQAQPYGYAAACNPCGQQVVNYVPQTCYRPQCTTVPVTTWRPFTSTDPCTGCPVTCMRPVVNYVRQTRMVAYTTYRPVVSFVPAAPVAAAAPACNPCGTPAYGMAPAYAPAGQPYYNGATGGTGVPTLPPGSSPGTSTFESSPTQRESQLPAFPDSEMNKRTPSAPTSAPRLIDPDSRTAAYPVQLAWGFTPVSWPARASAGDEPPVIRTAVQRTPVSGSHEQQPASTRPATIDDGGWRPSQR
ncbi:MAG: hypothetical protein WD847_17905 [Pirellulales bacterium]